MPTTRRMQSNQARSQGRSQARSRRIPVRKSGAGIGPILWSIGGMMLIGIVILGVYFYKGATAKGPGAEAAQTGALAAMGGIVILVSLLFFLTCCVLPTYLAYKKAKAHGVEPIIGLLLGFFMGWIGYIITCFLKGTKAAARPSGRRLATKGAWQAAAQEEEVEGIAPQKEEPQEEEPAPAPLAQPVRRPIRPGRPMAARPVSGARPAGKLPIRPRR